MLRIQDTNDLRFDFVALFNWFNNYIIAWQQEMLENLGDVTQNRCNTLSALAKRSDILNQKTMEKEYINYFFWWHCKAQWPWNKALAKFWKTVKLLDEYVVVLCNRICPLVACSMLLCNFTWASANFDSFIECVMPAAAGRKLLFPSYLARPDLLITSRENLFL